VVVGDPPPVDDEYVVYDVCAGFTLLPVDLNCRNEGTLLRSFPRLCKSLMADALMLSSSSPKSSNSSLKSRFAILAMLLLLLLVTVGFVILLLLLEAAYIFFFDWRIILVCMPSKLKYKTLGTHLAVLDRQAFLYWEL
jgi:hypothetical protein